MNKDITLERKRRSYIQENYATLSNKEIAAHLGITINAVKKVAGRLKLKKNNIHLPKEVTSRGKRSEPVEVDAPQQPRTGVEVRLGGQIVINWSNRTIVTDLGEFGSYVCNFSTHGAIQRYYVTAYEGKGHTAPETAQKFDFPHSKAVYLYAKIHGFTKASVPQTDLEFEEGLTPEEATDETIQSLKRKTMAMTERKKWEETQRDADSWNDFKHSVMYPMKDWVEQNLPKYVPPKVNVPNLSKEKYAAVVGVSDWHYLKHAYNHLGEDTYNRKLAKEALESANQKLLAQTLRISKPDVFYIPVGTDNLHFDNLEHTTTRGTSQAGQADGNWMLDLRAYVDIIIGMIELYAQVSPVIAVPMPGNHDKQTSMMLQVLLEKYYEKRKDVTVVNCPDPRVYMGYGHNAFMFTHGDSMSQSKLKGSAHKFFMGEAREQGIEFSVADHFAMFSGHVHHDHFEDLGVIKHFIIPSLSPSDSWHKEAGYIGSKKEAAMYLFEKNLGRQAVFYS